MSGDRSPVVLLAPLQVGLSGFLHLALLLPALPYLAGVRGHLACFMVMEKWVFRDIAELPQSLTSIL